MKLNLKRPIIFFDLETTGVDTAKDRIVEISMVKVMPDGEQIVKTRGSIPGCISRRKPRPSTASRTTT
jgi:Exonuclease.